MRSRILALSLGAAITLAGCASVPEGSVEAPAIACPEGSDCYDPPRQPGDGGAFTIESSVDGEFSFGEPQGQFAAGDIEVTFENEGEAEHDFTVVDANDGSEESPLVPPGESATFTVNLFPGEYVFYCSVSGHRSSGMEGTLTVGADGDVETDTDDADDA